jgi:two-component system response regulator HydG
MIRVLIIEDDITFTQILHRFLGKTGYGTTITHNLTDGLKAFGQELFDIILLDYRLPDGVGTDLVDTLHQRGTQTPPIIIMTSFHDIRTAVKAVRMGVYDYITKPVNPDELLMVIQEALKQVKEPSAEATARQFVEGNSEQSQQLQQYIRLIAPTDMSVIIQGESGTGKEQTAQSIHLQSKRRDGPFVAIDCGALSTDLASSELFGHVKGSFTGALQDKKGQFEAANGGTLFLDEVGNLSYEVQMKMLRAIQEREIQPIGNNKTIKVDVRIITATNDDLINSVKEGRFREDLYHRLNEFKIKIPSLQERLEDLDVFIMHFTEQANQELGKKVTELTPEVQELFYAYDWPGNLRELRNVIKRAVLLSTGSRITISTLPPEMVTAMPAKDSTESTDLKALHAANEKDLIVKTLKEVRYNKSKAARLLNIDRTTLYYKMSKYNIEG